MTTDSDRIVGIVTTQSIHPKIYLNQKFKLLLFFFSDKDLAPDNQDIKEPLPNKEQKFPFGSSSISSLPFQSVATSSPTNSPFGQKTSKSPSGFACVSTRLFTSPASADHDESATEKDHVPPLFEPIIPLPDKIDVKTGEEDEEVVFSHRAKLYRFVAEDKQWKVRGVGDIKLLKNRQTGKMRVLMRRDQVLNICANHQITSDMKLQPNAGSDRSWVWSTMADFSEQECRAERLAVKFKSADIAKQFKEKFEECQEMLKIRTPVKPQEEQKDEKAKEDLMSKYKRRKESWECNICMVRNDKEKVGCAACGSLKPGAQPRQGQTKEAKPLFSFGTGATSPVGGFSFGSDGTRQGDANQGFTLGSFRQTSNSSSGFLFRFASLKRGENISGQTGEATNVVAQSDGETSPKDVDDGGAIKQFKETFEECHGRSKNQSPVKLQEEQKHEEAKKDLMVKFKPAEGMWECNICMVRNDSHKVECAACLSLKPGADGHGQNKDTKPLFSLRSGASSLFDSSAKSQGDTKPGFTFDAVNQVKADLAKFKPSQGSWECGICMVRNDSDIVECVACRSLKPGAELSQDQTKDTKPLFSFGSSVASSGKGFSLDSRGTSQGDAKPLFTFGTLSQRSNFRSGVPFSFVKQEGKINQQIEESTNQILTSLKPTIEEQIHEKAKEDLMARLKTVEGTWDCDICLVRNDSDEVECVACSSKKPGTKLREGQRAPRCLLGSSAASLSGTGFSLGSPQTSKGDMKLACSVEQLSQTKIKRAVRRTKR